MRIPALAPGYSVQNFKMNKNSALLNYNKINSYADSVTFSRKYDKQKAEEEYKNLVKTVSKDISYEKPTVGVDDIRFLLKLNNKDFRKIITKPVKCEAYLNRPSKSTIFLYTDGPATKKLLDKLNDKEAAYEILSTKKDWRGTTALHAAAYAGDALKVKAICDAVSGKNCKKLMKSKEFGEDTPYEVAISLNTALCETFKKYYDKY